MQSLLLRWFRKHKRSLPWRETREPYKIWISEMMLQQTQINTVIPYYKRWMKHFPNVRKLARAPLSRVLKCWEGLGYYRRARHLHQTAKTIVRKWGGRFPESQENLQRLPGIGPYTAGAIASIAFNRAEPILDGNVTRVLSRLFALKEAVDQEKGKQKLWQISRKLVETVPPSSIGDFNQSLMELGALVCVADHPKCFTCPLKKICIAHRLKKEERFPIKIRREKLRRLKTVAAVIWKKGGVLLEKQPLRGRWGGLWIFPQWVYTKGSSEKNFLKEKIRMELKIRIKDLRPRMEIEHGFTKYRVRLRVYEGEILSSRRRLHWMKPNHIVRLPLPSPHQKIARSLQVHG